MEKKIYISTARTIATFFIVICHILQYNKSPYAFYFNSGVHIFLIISGLLYGRKEIKNVYKFYLKNFKKILTPYYILILFYFLVYIFTNIKITILDIGSNILCLQWLSNFKIESTNHLWYITCILLCYIITPALQVYFKDGETFNFTHIVNTVLLGLVLMILSYVTHIKLFYIYIYIISYIVSYTIDTYKIKINIKMLMSIIVLSVIFFIVRIVMECYGNGSYFIAEPQKLILACSVIALSKLFSKKLEGNCIVKYFDKYSYYIYLTHHIWILGTLSLMRITSCNFINIILITFIIIISSWILKKITSIVSIYFNKN